MEENIIMKENNYKFRFLCLIFAVYFIFALTLQFNDNNPIIGITHYSSALLITLIAFFNKVHVLIFSLIFLISILLTIYWYIRFFISLNICIPLQFNLCQEAQEAFGLTITTIWILIIIIKNYNKIRNVEKYTRFY